jgi:alpha-N-arabinofuranosidase
MNQIKIDLERVISDIDRDVFGGFLDVWWADPKYGYVDKDDSPRNDIRAALQRVNFSNLRYPGGNDASGYRWIDGVGPRQERPVRHDLAFYNIAYNYYGTNEFCHFCRKLNIEPDLIVNCGDGNMREAADWVEYCNGTGDTALVKLRQKHGFAAPHKVKFWSIGNEVDNPNQIGAKTPQEYARAITEFSKVMKRVDPDIKLIASGVCNWEDFPSSPTAWVERAQLMLEQAGDRIDYIAIHRYDHLFEDEPYENYMAFAADFNERLIAYEGIIRAVSLERGIKHHIGIAVDEWTPGRRPIEVRGKIPISVTVDEHGIQHLPSDNRGVLHPRGVSDSRNKLEDAVVVGLYLNAFIRHAGAVRFASFHPMPVKGVTTLGRPEGPLVLQSIFYPFELYSRTCGQIALDVFWKSDTFSGTYGNRSYAGIRTLDVAATLDKTRKQLVVYVINQEKEKTMEATISLTDGLFTGNVQLHVINGPDLKSKNTEEKPDTVGVKKTSLQVSGKSFAFTFEPHSVTALVCAVN